MTLEKSEILPVSPFKPNDWTEFARRNKINVRITPIIHRSPRLGPEVKGKRTLSIGSMNHYRTDSPWDVHIKELQHSAGYRNM